MNLDWVKTLSFFIVLLLVQVLVFNHIHLFGYATPLLYVYFVLPARRGFPNGLCCCGLSCSDCRWMSFPTRQDLQPHP